MTLTMDEYQKLSERTMQLTRDKRELLANFCMGLAGEVGEVVDLLKKHLFHGHELNEELAEEELGDAQFYIAGIASVLRLTLGGVGAKNVAKLKRRYPAGFSEEASRNRPPDVQPTQGVAPEPVEYWKQQADAANAIMAIANMRCGEAEERAERVTDAHAALRADRDRLREALAEWEALGRWLNVKGGLGYDVHGRLGELLSRAALSKGTP